VKLLWSPLALDRVNEAADYIAEDSQGAAERWVEQVLQAVDRLQTFPNSGRAVPEVGDSRLRELLVAGYRVIYRVADDQVHILTVRHGRRLLDFYELDDG
jgi:toxin ParE1/3/4